METSKNPQAIFEQAIKEGLLSDKETDPHYAGNFMYMYTNVNKHYFKNSVTRLYGCDKESIRQACAQ